MATILKSNVGKFFLVNENRIPKNSVIADFDAVPGSLSLVNIYSNRVVLASTVCTALLNGDAANAPFASAAAVKTWAEANLFG
jgi:hypothetical protein